MTKALALCSLRHGGLDGPGFMLHPFLAYGVAALAGAGAWLALRRLAAPVPATAEPRPHEAATPELAATEPPKPVEESSRRNAAYVAPTPALDESSVSKPSASDDVSGPIRRILVHAVGSTDAGRLRDHNEDAFTILDDAHLFVVADGMGRHAAGEVASQICIDTVRDVFRDDAVVPPLEPPLPKRGAKIRHAIIEANARILRAAQANEKYAGMGTTVVSVIFSPYSQRAFIAHVGDSRCYRLRGHEIVQLTADHTLGAVGFTGKRAAFLSRAVGTEEHLDVEVAVECPLPGDVYLLCSDGLTRMVEDSQILATVSAHRNDLDVAVAALITVANERGGRDNITAILVRVDDAPL